MKATTEFPAALFPWRAYWLVQTVWRRKNTNIPPVEMRKSGLRPTRSHSKPPVQARINDHKLRNALINNCSTGSVTVYHKRWRTKGKK